MELPTLQNRLALANRIRSLRHQIAQEVTDEFLSRHPDWVDRYGDRAKRLGIEDACYHQDYLAGAIEAGSRESYQNYSRWTSSVLDSRGIAPSFLKENLLQIETALSPHLNHEDQTILRSFIEAGCDGAESTDPDSPMPATKKLSLVRNVYLQTLLQGSRKPALTVALEAIDQGCSFTDFYVDVLQGAMYEVGRLWQLNKITVAQEHMATAITQYVLAQLYERLPRAEQFRGKAVITGVSGELHQLGANMVADALEADGWDVRFLGANMPHEGILTAVDEHQAHVVGISATMLFNIPMVRQLVADIRKQISRPIRIILGGSAFRLAPNLYREIGADAFAPELRTATALLRAFQN